MSDDLFSNISICDIVKRSICSALPGFPTLEFWRGSDSIFDSEYLNRHKKHVKQLSLFNKNERFKFYLERIGDKAFGFFYPMTLMGVVFDMLSYKFQIAAAAQCLDGNSECAPVAIGAFIFRAAYSSYYGHLADQQYKENQETAANLNLPLPLCFNY